MSESLQAVGETKEASKSYREENTHYINNLTNEEFGKGKML